MATVVSMTNPLTGAVEQVDQLDHTAQQIDDAVALAPQLSNHNILDNWYFGNPVNQRGQTEYTRAGYTIDRWKIGSGEKLTVLDGCCRVECTAASGRSFAQILDANLAGKTVTFSVLIKAISNTAVAYVSNSSGSSLKSMSITAPGLWSMTVTIPDDVTSVLVQVNQTIVGDTVDLIAAKLELGSQQTLAHQDADGNWALNEIPDYGEQLRRCQRYFVNFNPYKQAYFAMPPAVTGAVTGGVTKAFSVVTLPVAMRAQPVVSYGGTIFLSQTGDAKVTSIGVSASTFTGIAVQLMYVTDASLTADSLYRVQGGKDPTSYIHLSADL